MTYRMDKHTLVIRIDNTRIDRDGLLCLFHEPGIHLRVHVEAAEADADSE